MIYKALPIILFYILTFSNYNFYLLSCELRKILESNILLNHLVGLLTIYTFIITSIPSFKNKSITYNIYFSIISYILFLISVKIDIRALLILFILGLVSIQLDNLVERSKEENNKEKVAIYTDYRKKLESIMYIILAIGFIVYTIKILNTNGVHFNLNNFIFGDYKCNKLKYVSK